MADKVQKKPSEMTESEKYSKISYLEHKFYDIDDGKASALLEQEVALYNLSNDPFISANIRQLKTMEQHTIKLVGEYNVRFTNEMHPLVRGFQQQMENLVRQHKHERAQLLASSYPERKITMSDLLTLQTQEITKLKQDQTKQKKALHERLSEPINKSRRAAFFVFSRVVRQIYR